MTQPCEVCGNPCPGSRRKYCSGPCYRIGNRRKSKARTPRLDFDSPETRRWRWLLFTYALNLWGSLEGNHFAAQEHRLEKLHPRIGRSSVPAPNEEIFYA